MTTSQRQTMSKKEMEELMSELEMVNTTDMSLMQIQQKFGQDVAAEVALARKAYKKGKSVSAANLFKKYAGRAARTMGPVIILAGSLMASDVQWTRFRGTVKALDLDKGRVTIQDESGDLLGIPVDANVRIFEGKDQVSIDKLQLDAKIQLQYIPVNQKALQALQETPKEQ
jgi:Cu/Ag efflux protein CusF